MSIVRRLGGMTLLLVIAACTTQPEVSASASAETSGEPPAAQAEASAALDPWANADPRSAAADPPCHGSALRGHEVARRLQAALHAWRQDRDPDELRRALVSLLLRLGGCSAEVPPSFPGEVCVGSHQLHLVPQPGGCLTFPFDASFTLDHVADGFAATYDGSAVSALVAPACDGIWCAVSFSVIAHGHGAPPFHIDFVLQLGPVVTGTAHRQDIGAEGDDGCPTTYTITAD